MAVREMKLRIGDRVRQDGNPLTDGTVVDVIDPRATPQLVRVYWRHRRVSKVSDCHASNLVLVR